ncbi:MAG: hypothetical protein AUK47_16020 [Deltaproteobacteria bacterium CG2_30_63_29]|nr:MAG: hypothetical protein AUK47_16020 [Deltaproteobacteria bacterium CG2_30_63_29]
MAGFKTSGDDDVLSDINVTPLVDVVLVLLIIFMVTASAIVKAAIAVDLPKASTAETVTRPPLSIILACTEKQGDSAAVGCTPGQLLVDGEAVLDLADPNTKVDPLVGIIRSKVEQAAKEAEREEDKGLSVLITADKDLKFQNVIWLMDLLKNEGVASIMFNSELFTNPSDARAMPK